MLVFVIIGLVGFFFLIVSALFGGDHDGGLDHDHDIGHDVGPNPFSLRIISLFLTGFGATGAIGQSYGLGYPVSAAIGVVSGAIMGYAGYSLIHMFMRQQASSTVSDEDMVGILGQVSVAIPAGGLGQVEVLVRGKRHYPSARALREEAIAEGAQVKVVRCAGNQVVVEKI